MNELIPKELRYVSSGAPQKNPPGSAIPSFAKTTLNDLWRGNTTVTRPAAVTSAKPLLEFEPIDYDPFALEEVAGDPFEEKKK